MPVDTSMYTVPTPPNYLAMGQQAVQLGNSALQNRLLSGQVSGGQALGNALAAATNADGSIDTGKLNNALAAASSNGGPMSLYVPQALSAAAQATSNQGAQVDQANSRINNFYNALGPLALSGQPLTHQDVITEASRRVATKQLTAQDLTAISGMTPFAPKDVTNFVRQRYQQTLGPGQATEAQTGISDTGAPIVGTTVQRLNRATSAPASAGAGASNTSGIQTQLSPAETANQSSYLSDQQKSSQTMANVRQLQTALPLVEGLAHGDFGPGSPELAKLKGLFATAGLIDPNSTNLPDRQMAGKYLLKYASGAVSAGRSDNALSAAIGSNPNLDLTQPANIHLVKNQIGMDRMDAALPAVADLQYPSAAARNKNYGTFKSSFYQNYDPRAFSYDLYTPEERRNIVDSLGPQNSPAFKKFAQSYAIAKKTAGFTSQATPATAAAQPAAATPQ